MFANYLGALGSKYVSKLLLKNTQQIKKGVAKIRWTGHKRAIFFILWTRDIFMNARNNMKQYFSCSCMQWEKYLC